MPDDDEVRFVATAPTRLSDPFVSWKNKLFSGTGIFISIFLDRRTRSSLFARRVVVPWRSSMAVLSAGKVG